MISLPKSAYDKLTSLSYVERAIIVIAFALPLFEFFFLLFSESAHETKNVEIEITTDILTESMQMTCISIISIEANFN